MLFARHFIPFFCQKVLPTVYDNSLSYYEFLCKMYRELCKYIELNDKNVESLALKIESMESPDGISDVVMRGTVDSEGAVTITSVTKNYEDVYFKVRDGEAVLLKFLYTYESEDLYEREHVAIMRIEGNTETGSTLMFTGLDTFNMPHSTANGYDTLTMCRLDWRSDRATFITTEHHIPTANDVDTMITEALSGYTTPTDVNELIAEALVGYATEAYVQQRIETALAGHNVSADTVANVTEYSEGTASRRLNRTGNSVIGQLTLTFLQSTTAGTLIAENFPTPKSGSYHIIGHKVTNLNDDYGEVVIAQLTASATTGFPADNSLFLAHGAVNAGDHVVFDFNYCTTDALIE